MRSIFIPVVGQYDNIGDVILRRALLRWLQRCGRVHAYVGGSAPAGYVSGLQIGPEHVVHPSLRHWARLSISDLKSTTPAAYVFKPGEIQMTVRGLKEHLGLLPILTTIKARGGPIVRVGVGSRNQALLPGLLVRPSVWLSDLSLWRDEETRDFMRRGEVIPDLAFEEGARSHDLRDASPSGLRLVVSLRSDRPYPSDTWVRAVREFARSAQLEIVVVTQVARDAPRSVALRRELDAELLNWDGRDHVAQESALRDIYAHCAGVISDRLHVLIAGVTEGAVPVGLVERQETKVARHFAAAGFTGVAINCEGWTMSRMCAALHAAVGQRATALANLREARERLALARDQVERALT